MIISCVRTLSSLSSVGAREGVVARSRGGHGRAWDAWDGWTLSELGSGVRARKKNLSRPYNGENIVTYLHFPLLSVTPCRALNWTMITLPFTILS
jgi:hypothetical protein